MTATYEKTSSIKANEFWLFSCDFYKLKGVKECLLSLQDNFQFNVNEVLLCAWLAYVENKTLNKDQVVELIKSSQQSKNWVARQRKLRQEITSSLNNLLKEELLALELHLEKLHQSILVESCSLANLMPDPATSAAERFRLNLSLLSNQQKWTDEFDNLTRLLQSYFNATHPY